MKKRCNYFLGVLLSLSIGLQPLMAAAQPAPMPGLPPAPLVEPTLQTESGQVLNPLILRLANKTLRSHLFNRVSDAFAPSGFARVLLGYFTMPEKRTHFLDEDVEESSHLMEVLLKQKKCVTTLGFVRTAYESLIINNKKDLLEKQAFINAIVPKAIDGALRQIALAETQTLDLLWKKENFAVPVDISLLATDARLLHSLASETSTTYNSWWEKIKLLVLRYPLLTLGLLYTVPALSLYTEGKGAVGFIKNYFTGGVQQTGVEAFDALPIDRKILKNHHAAYVNGAKLAGALETQKMLTTPAPASASATQTTPGSAAPSPTDTTARIAALDEHITDLQINNTLLFSQFTNLRDNRYTGIKAGNSLDIMTSPLLWADYAKEYVWRAWTGKAKDATSIRADQFHLSTGLAHAMKIGLSGFSLWQSLKMFKNYQNALVNLAQCLRSAHGVYQYLQRNDLLKYLTQGERDAFEHTFNKEKQKDSVKRLFELLATDTFKEAATSVLPITYQAGRIGAAATLLSTVKEDLVAVLNAIGHVDYIAGLKKMIIDSSDQKNDQGEPLVFSLTEFVDSPTPVLELKNEWFPLYETKAAVPATLTLGGAGQPHHLLITGVNGTGKSGVMLSTLNAIMMSMTHGIAPTECTRMTLFPHIHSHMNVGDAQGENRSGFQNEVNHFATIMALIRSNAEANKMRTNPEFFFFAHDESFRSTDAESAERLAWGLLNFLNNDPYTVSLCATHLNRLTVIEQTTNGNVKNAYIQTELEDGEDGYKKPIYTRKLVVGGSNAIRGMAVPIALDAIRRAGGLTPEVKALFTAAPPHPHEVAGTIAAH